MVTDQALRRLEREAKNDASKNPELLRVRFRTGHISRDVISDAAFIGNLAAENVAGYMDPDLMDHLAGICHCGWCVFENGGIGAWSTGLTHLTKVARKIPCRRFHIVQMDDFCLDCRGTGFKDFGVPVALAIGITVARKCFAEWDPGGSMVCNACGGRAHKTCTNVCASHKKLQRKLALDAIDAAATYFLEPTRNNQEAWWATYVTGLPDWAPAPLLMVLTDRGDAAYGQWARGLMSASTILSARVVKQLAVKVTDPMLVLPNSLSWEDVVRG